MSNLTLDVHTADGSTNGTVELPSSVFDVEVSTPLLHQVVTAQLAARRQGTHATKTRGQVRGGVHPCAPVYRRWHCLRSAAA